MVVGVSVLGVVELKESIVLVVPASDVVEMVGPVTNSHFMCLSKIKTHHYIIFWSEHEILSRGWRVIVDQHNQVQKI